MTALSVPKNGLVLLRTPERGPASNNILPSQVIRLNLAQKITEELLRGFQNKEKISIRFGKRVTLQHGRRLYPVFASPESYPSELYECSADDDDTFYFSGKLSHKLETQKAQIDTAKADEALANLEQSLRSYEEQKASNEARIVTDKDELRHLTEASQKGKGHSSQPSAVRKDRLLNTVSRSSPSTPFLGAAPSPAIGPASAAKLVPASVSKDQIRLNALKIPFLHLLAAQPTTPRVLAETIHATKDECDRFLHKYGKVVQETNAKQELKDKAYRELDVWKFPYPSESDRQAAIDRTISAFDRMRISTSDHIWETLLPAKERGKGKGLELSRLKIGQAGFNGMTPKVGLSQRVAHSVTDTDTDQGKPVAKAKRSTTKTKPRSGADEDLGKNPSLRKAATKQPKDMPAKDTAKKEKRKGQPNGKFKSSEVIEDSDEELEKAERRLEDNEEFNARLNSKVKSSTIKQASRPATATTSSKPPMSSFEATKVASSLMPSAALTRPRPGSVTNKASPRPRTDSSPQKPSPLASSPPTNATDLDNSQSSKANSLSSTTTSPLVSPPRDRGQRIPAPPKAMEPRLPSTALKRKAEEQSSPAPKRQQLNDRHIARPITNGVGKSRRGNGNSTTKTTTKTTATNTASSSQRSRTPSSSSACTSTSTTTTTSSSSAAAANPMPSTLQSALQLTSKSRRFKIQYARYQELHAKIIAMPEGERDAEEVKVLRKMHARIGELKREIWEGWEKRGH